MIIKSIKSFFICLLFSTVALISGCGDSGSGGDVNSSTSAAISLKVDKETVAAGTDTLQATVTGVSLTGQTLNVSVDLISDGNVISTNSGIIDASCVTAISIPVPIVESDRTYYVQAKSNGVNPSNLVAVAVKAPVLSSTIPASSSGTGSVEGNTVTFTDGAGSPISGAEITFTLDSKTDDSSGVIEHNNANVEVGSNFIITTDSAGSANTALTFLLSAPGTVDVSNVVTFNYTLSAIYKGMTFTKQLSAQYTVTAAE